MGHDGFTIHALATIVRRPPAVILKELLASEWGVKLSHCLTIKSPVVMPNVKTSYDGSTFSWLPSRFNDWNGKAVVPLMKTLLVAYPWPKYKGTKNGEGITDLPTPANTLKVLRAVAKNKIHWEAEP